MSMIIYGGKMGQEDRATLEKQLPNAEFLVWRKVGIMNAVKYLVDFYEMKIVIYGGGQMNPSFIQNLLNHAKSLDVIDRICIFNRAGMIEKWEGE